MQEAAAAAGRDPDAIKFSIVGYPLIGDDPADYRARLEERAAARDRDPDEFEAFMKERGLLHGVVDDVRAQLAAHQAVGVDRLYIQVYAPLDDIDTEEVGRVLRLLRD